MPVNRDIAEQALATLRLPLQDWLDDPGITELMVNGPRSVWIERGGVLQRIPAVLPPASVMASARLVATLSAQDTLDEQAVLEGTWQGWRMTFVLPPVSLEHACLSMRRHRADPVQLGSWRAASSSLGEPLFPRPTEPQQATTASLREALTRHHNILISGSTGAGKTTLLASLLAELGDRDRLVCLEDSPELPRIGDQQVRLQTRQGHTLRTLLRIALRLRPDRLVIGEVRGAEAFDLLQAMATGHRGCLGTIHAPDPLGALARLEQLILTAGLDWPLDAIRSQVRQWIDVVVQVARTPGGRMITGIYRPDALAVPAAVPLRQPTGHNRPAASEES